MPPASSLQPPASKTLGIVGIGAFGSFILPHLKPHFDITIYDVADVVEVARRNGVTVGELRQVASCDIVLLAVPVQKMEAVLAAIAPHLKQGALVADVASVKIRPTKLMQKILPDSVSIVGTHPLFGPQSGKNGIEGLKVAVCNVRGNRAEGLCRFFSDDLRLNVIETTPEDHDRQMAFVQGLTHLIGKVIVRLDLPEFQMTTRTYDLMNQMVGMIRYDSDELFKAIERENPFTAEAKKAFFAAARQLEEALANNGKE